MYYEKKISNSMKEHKQLGFSLDLKMIDTQGQFAGYASVFDAVDNQHDVMLHGAFAKTLQGRSSDIKLLWQHKQQEPIGIFTRIFEDKLGLYVEGKLLLDIARAKEAHSLLKAKAINGLSIGYSPVRYTVDPDTGIRFLKEVDLWEVSLVTFPANSAANVTVVKQSSAPLDGCAQEQWSQACKAGSVLELASALDKAIYSLKNI